MSCHRWKFEDLELVILDLIMKRFKRNMSGMEPSFNRNVQLRNRALNKRLLEANSVWNITF